MMLPMPISLCYFLLHTCCYYSTAYKMALFVPSIVNSQVLFNRRIAQILADAGHDVTMIFINSLNSDSESKYVDVENNIKIYYVNASGGMSKKEFLDMQESIIFEDLSIWDKRLHEGMARMTTLSRVTCQKMVENKELLKWLTAERFDIAFSHVVGLCPIGLIYKAQIPTWIWLDSTPLADYVAYFMGMPIIPSYIPPYIMEAADRMSFLERTKSFLGHLLLVPMWKRLLADRETEIFREQLDPDFPDLVDLAKNCPLVMVNSNELYDFPRPTLAKVINIGGVGIQMKKSKPLDSGFQHIYDRATGVFVFSFGSIAPSHKMPMSWKEAFIGAFKRYPSYHFIWRYVGSDLQGKLPPNVHTFKWLPQSDLLQSNKTISLITHGGYNSVQEAITAGIPLLVIPLFGDQPKNAKLAEKHGIAIVLQKSDLSADSIAAAINKVLTDKSYSGKVKRLSQMLKKKPVSVSQLLVRWTEFVAEFKTLENLIPAGNKLNFIQYYSLDVIAFLSLLVLLTALIVWKLLRFAIAKTFDIMYALSGIVANRPEQIKVKSE
ncbi:unnamed protein product [Cylicocyclus nassatus]|uniref:glucuronosyltransferase n=1 Tax=Cylicocyclus nassatus TaxID=53992 RepID=A0AA36MAQ1_CYLNA|nr:unnamed protein product [Cylicocyclus nassatus]